MIVVGLGKRRWKVTLKSGKVKRCWSYQARWKTPAGRDTARSLHTQDYQRARALVVELESLLNGGVHVEPVARGMTWEQAWEHYDALRSRVLDGTTMVNSYAAWRRFWDWAPVKRLDQVTPMMVTQFRNWCVDEEGLSPNTVSAYLVRLKTVWNKLAKQQVLPGANPFAPVEYLPGDVKAKSFLSAEQAQVLLGVAAEAGREMHLVVALGLYAGLRPVEIRNIRWDWVCWEDTGWIAIPAQDGDFRPKNRRSRNIPLAPALRAILLQYREAPRAFVVEPRVTTDDSVRPRVNIPIRFRVLVRKAGLPAGTSPYTMRHTFASNLLKAGVSLYKVMDWMGHRDVTTLQVYGHLSPADDAIGHLYKEGSGS